MLFDNMRRDYINYIGIDGAGKDVIFDLTKSLFPNAVLTREPGGTPEAEIIREVILSNSLFGAERISLIQKVLKMDINAETRKLLLNAAAKIEESDVSYAEPYLYAASRSEGIEKVIQPALSKGLPVLGRRSVACSVSYQGNARNFGMETVWELNYPIVKNCLPSLEIFFDVPVEVAMARLSKRTEKHDRLDGETRAFFEKAREGYLYYYQNLCPYPYAIIDATQTIEQVHEKTVELLKKRNIL